MPAALLWRSRWLYRRYTAMRPTIYSPDAIRVLLDRQTIATLPQLVAALGNCSQRTAVRKLSSVPHLTSYSHNGKFYVLLDRPHFDAYGLWSFHDVRFSSHGTLLNTVAALVCDSHSGFRSEELDALVQVRTGNALRRLVRLNRLAREQRLGHFWYAAPDPAVQARQRAARQAMEELESLPPAQRPSRGDLGQAQRTFLASLDERQRRWFAGLESLRRGHGGDRRAAALLDMHPATVARGRRELVAGEELPGRVRKPGAGRKRLEKKACAQRLPDGTTAQRNRR